MMPNKNEWRGIPVKVSDVAKRISGILYIVDNNVEPKTKFQLENPLSTMESYLYINPNVDTKNKNAFFFENLAQGVAYKRLALHYDDFLYDNY